MTEKRVKVLAKRLFKCDEVRLIYLETIFLVVGWWRTSSDEWSRNGRPFTFRYLEEKTIASGKTLRGLWDDALEYERMSKLSMEQYLHEKMQSGTGTVIEGSRED